ncbi:hypothetical protein BDP55DRAFT_687149 [Colletotrichum godetiae]|uniref:Uncharacterized protein n=1 Tax=Colletotrichum godetiae TaxID=1209918 RepID=A0AAJ0EMX2_9PEZI|nr:uncharacterized protein BDP55DRAFT_687149 [Colletotrichum godetiae]KAK1656987.1 hypothetical protein BDP55DRAFT_687149 [Colletotrichum godetiae]
MSLYRGLTGYAAASGRLLLLRCFRMCAGETHPLPGAETGPRRARLPQNCRGPFDFPTEGTQKEQKERPPSFR